MGTKNDLTANFSEEQMKTTGVASLKTGSDPAKYQGKYHLFLPDIKLYTNTNGNHRIKALLITLKLQGTQCTNLVEFERESRIFSL